MLLFVFSVSTAYAEDRNGVHMGGEEGRKSNCIPAHLLLESEHGSGPAEEHIVAESCDKPEKPAAKPEKDCRPAKEETGCKKVDEKVALPCKPERKPEVTPDACKPEKKEDKHEESDADVAPPCKPEKPEEVKPLEEPSRPEDENSESDVDVVVVSPEESGTGGSEEGVVSHGRSKDYDKVKIIPVANLSSGINLTIEKPSRYVTGNIVELMAGTNLTQQQEAAMGLKFKWKIYGKSFYSECVGKNLTVYLPDGDYSVNLTAVYNRNKETSVGKIVTVKRVGSDYAPECGIVEKRGRESVSCDLWGGSCFLLCYENFKFVGVSWVHREEIVGQDKLSHPKQCFVKKAVSESFGKGNNRNRNNSKVAFYAG